MRPESTLELIGRGVFRDGGEERTLCISFNRKPTDDELRAVHDFFRRSPANCPFCSKPTYRLPCTHCGEPDTPEGF